MLRHSEGPRFPQRAEGSRVALDHLNLIEKAPLPPFLWSKSQNPVTPAISKTR